ncbi:MAG: 5'-methylthioadenosine/adenosylhomocysteine nucleosidase [Clostridiales bacterium]|nr:5'-methylthioadenosine/adenosylhomocysteine nucleosidase [Clostridiales bacterium]
MRKGFASDSFDGDGHGRAKGDACAKAAAPIGIIGALALETEGLKARLSALSAYTIGRLTFFTGRLASRDVVLCCCGVGKVYAAMAASVMIERFRPDALINLGVAGGIAPLKQKDIVVAASAVQHDYSAVADGLLPGQIQGYGSPFIPCDPTLCEGLYAAARALGFSCFKGTVASGDRFIDDSQTARYLKEQFGASAVDMESAAVAQVCFELNVPFTALRSVSDNADEKAVGSFYEFVLEASKRSIAAVEYFLTQPLSFS